MEPEVNTCQIHGLPFVKVTRRRVKVELFDIKKNRYYPYKGLPPERDQVEYLCARCDFI